MNIKPLRISLVNDTYVMRLLFNVLVHRLYNIDLVSINRTRAEQLRVIFVMIQFQESGNSSASFYTDYRRISLIEMKR